MERKASFIAQVSTGQGVEREVDDIGEQALSFAEVKALASGNPLILEKAGVDAEVARLNRLRRSHQDDQHRLKRALSAAEERAAKLGRRITDLEAAIGRRRDTRGERFEMTVEGESHRSRADAGHDLQRLLGALVSRRQGTSETAVGRLGGFEVRLALDHLAGEAILSLLGLEDDVGGSVDELLAADPTGLVRRLEHRLQALDAALTDAMGQERAIRAEAERARSRLGAAFPYGEALRSVKCRQQDINERLLQAPDDEAAVERSFRGRMTSRLEVIASTGSPMLRL